MGYERGMFSNSREKPKLEPQSLQISIITIVKIVDLNCLMFITTYDLATF